LTLTKSPKNSDGYNSHLSDRVKKVPFLGWAIAISILLHLVSAVNLTYLSDKLERLKKSQTNTNPVNITFVDDESSKKILEVKQKETKPPKKSSRFGHTNHATEKETKLADDVNRVAGAEAGRQGNNGDSLTKSRNRNKKSTDEPQSDDKHYLTSDDSKVLLPESYKKAKRKFEALLPSRQDLAGQINAGFQDYIEDEVEIGDSIDMNTSEYKYISYFSHMRKSIELVWSYPSLAIQQGMQGAVKVQFIIGKEGKTRRIRIVGSSGYSILDRAILEAIKDASPLPPLPERFDKDQLLITGTFEYVLRNFAVSH
jgi:protein TonB